MAERRRRSMLLPCNENVPPPSPLSGDVHRCSQKGAVSEKIAAMRDKLSEKTRREKEAELARSPTLVQLQRESAKKERPARGSVMARQRELERLHHEAKSRLEGVGGIGGGVSLWPAMDDMRLSRSDAVQLAFLCLSLILSTTAVFFMCHGTHLEQLGQYHSVMIGFSSSHPLHLDRGQESFDEDLLQWHTDLLSLQSAVQSDFDVVWPKVSSFYVLSILLYISGVALLLYFLAENVFSRNRLTPRRVKIWVCLMCIVAVWSLLSAHLLLSAQRLETDMETATLSLTDHLAGLVSSGLELTHYRDILLYWQTRYLHPHCRGLLSVLGLLPVRDVSFYLHYYSLPLLTALCSPIIKLVVSLRAVYGR